MIFDSSSVDLTKKHNGETKIADIRWVIDANVTESIYYDVLLQTNAK